MDKQQFCKTIKTFKASLRERERESLRDFDLEFHTFNNLKRYFYSAFLIAQNYV